MKIVHLTDLHFGHPKVNSNVLRNNIVEYVYPELIDGTDLLIISGDFFDNLLNMNSESGFNAAAIINELKHLALEYNFLIRVLRGTYTHDRRQVRFFIIDEKLNKSVDNEEIIKVYENVSVERIKRLNISLLFLPDDLPYTDINSVIETFMTDNLIDKFDIVVTHGYYEHLLPPTIPDKPKGMYTNKQFNKILNGVVLNGHVHTPTIYDKIITGGSFERLSHGEEEPKGFFVIDYDNEKRIVKHRFVANRRAYLFKSIDLSDCKSCDVATDVYTCELDKILDNDISEGDVHIRVISDDPSIRQSIINISRGKKKRIHITYKKSGDVAESIISRFTLSDLPVINEANLGEHIKLALEKFNIFFTIDEINEVIA